MLTAMDKAQIAQSLAQSLLLDPLNDGLSLVRRYQEVRGLRSYVAERAKLLAPIAVLVAATSLACAAATVMYVGGMQPILVLFSLLLAPIILAGSGFVQAYIYLSWLENRALANALRHPLHPGGPIRTQLRKAGIDLGALPRVPWVLTLVFLLLPLSMLVAIVPRVGITLVLLHFAAPFVFARFDR
jgi:hypothetical protein